METITKEKIATALKVGLGLSGAICEEIVDQTFNSIQEIIIKEQKLTLNNFGSFKVRNKNSRPGINLKTKKRVAISARKIVNFIPAKLLKTLIKGDG